MAILTRAARTDRTPVDPATEPPAPRRTSPHTVLAAALLAFFVISLDGSVVNVALPAISSSLRGSMADLQWIVDGYTLMFAAFMLSAGTFSDRVGASRAYAWGLAAFTVASLACGVAPNLGTLIGARMVQGGAAALMVPASLALIRQSYTDPGKRARAIAIWTAAGSVAVAIGPVVGGMLTSGLSWRAVFYLNLPVGAIGLALLTRIAPSPRRQAPVDLLGQFSVVVGLAGLTYAVIEGGREGWASTSVLGTLVVAAAAAALFVTTQSRSKQPMVPLSLFKSRTVLVCLAAGFTINAVFYGAIFLLGMYFQQVRGASPVSAGAMFIPMCALISVVNMAGVKLAARKGARVPMAIGQLIMAGGSLLMLTVTPHTSFIIPVLLLVPIGLGGGLAVPSLTAAILEHVDSERAGTAAAVLNTSRQVGSCLAVAAFGALIADTSRFQHGMDTSFVISVAMLLATAAATAFLLPRLTHKAGD
ncbi:DHA2 family methylenomycin A resistance protein-like MFS transporter [Streptomyces sp. LBL]|uniref:MFS transporter n=1 Tax=Streptomyces sp. LBL TaxID=2940562 RepID=UPI002475C213|nr:MFS transporter [Streptomyces sp. LBL]MDH6624472.1 DHA2 family methylenomycin A resistance protein-like MFS transporter [Streptomyces sp. LBL]